MKYRITYVDASTEEVECDGMQTGENFTLFIRLNKVQPAEGQAPIGEPLLICGNDQIRAIRNIDPQPLALVED